MRQQDYRMVQGVNQIVNMNPNIAASGGNAMARLGRQLAVTGKDISGIMEETARKEDETTLFKMQQRWQEAKGNQLNFERENPDTPEDWDTHFQKGLTNIEAHNNEYKFNTKEGRAKYMMLWDGWKGNEGYRIGQSSHSKRFTNNIKEGVALAGIYQENGNFNASRQIINGLPLIESEKITALNNIDKNERNFNLKEDIASNPYLAEDNIDSYGFPTEHEKKVATNAIKSAQRQETAESSMAAIEGISDGSIVHPDMIDKLFDPRASKIKVKEAYDFLKDFNDQNLKERMSTPKMQKDLRMSLLRRIEALDPQDNYYNEEKVGIQKEMAWLTDPADKKELDRLIQQNVTGDKTVSKKIESIAIQQLKPFEPRKPEGTSYGQYAREGKYNQHWLGKMTNIPEGQAEDISNAFSKAGDPRQGFRLYQKAIAKLGNNAFKKKPEDMSTWEYNIYAKAADSGFSNAAAIAYTNPRQSTAYREAQEFHTYKASKFAEGLKAELGNQDWDNLSLKEQSDMLREMEQHYNDDFLRKLKHEEEIQEVKDNKTSQNLIKPDLYRSSSSSQRMADFKEGKYYISNDANKADGVPIIQPVAIIPPNSPQPVVDAVNVYASEMAALHNRKFGRNFKGSVRVTGAESTYRGEKTKQRGSAGVIHLEGYAITDKDMVEYLKTKEGHAEYQRILDKSFGMLSGATIGLPHTARDNGAIDDDTGDSEVGIAKLLLSDYPDTRLSQN